MSIFKNYNYPLVTTEEDIKFIFDMCKNSTYVATNDDYKRKAKSTGLELQQNDSVNAYAQSLNEQEHQIAIFTGLCNAYKVMGLALAEFMNPQTRSLDQLISVCNYMGEAIEKNGYEMSYPMISEAFEEFNYNPTGLNSLEGKSYFTGMLLSVVAHELGHICLGHTVRNDGTLETSRNDERCADLFAQSIISTTPFGSHCIMGSLFTEILFAWMGKNNSGPATTHPLSVERVYNILHSHDYILAELGITEDNIKQFLPRDFNGEEPEIVIDTEE